MPPQTTPPAAPSFGEAVRFWVKLGFISFGGPAGQIAIMHRELVEKRRWLSERHFLHALNFCMLLPGPEAQQLATYLGWRLHGARGGIAAGILFVLPSVFILYALSWIYVTSGTVAWVAALFHGLMPAVIAIVASAVLRIGRKALKTPALWLISAASFAAIFFGNVSFVLIIAGAAAVGWTGVGLAPSQFPISGAHGDPLDSAESRDVVTLPPAPTVTWRRTLGVALVCIPLWWGPVLLAAVWLGLDSTPFRQGVFFSKAALVTFGGAYAVLPYVAQRAVDHYAWLTHTQMMSGLGLAESTPGPLIMVLQFVGFVGGWQHPGALTPLTGATLGALMTTWVTFVPCFLFVFLGGPHVERLREHKTLSGALTAVTAAVVGVILNLAVWFAWHAVHPAPGQWDGFVAVVAVAAFVIMEKLKTGVIPVLAACAVLGWLWSAAW